jgi:site-specific recombinase XerD
VLRGYLLLRPADAQDDLVFQSKFRRGMGPRSIGDVVNKHLRTAGTTDASVHDLRHTYAVHSVMRGMELSAVQDVLGYEHLRSTTIYVELARQLQEHAL